MKPRIETPEPKTSHLNIEISRELHKRLRQQAIEEDRPIGDVTSDAIIAYLAKEAPR